MKHNISILQNSRAFNTSKTQNVSFFDIKNKMGLKPKNLATEIAGLKKSVYEIGTVFSETRSDLNS